MDRLGVRFWLWLIGVTVGLIAAAFLIFALIGWAWYAWGFFGTFVVFAGVLLAIAWFHDKREARRYEDLDASSSTTGS